MPSIRSRLYRYLLIRQLAQSRNQKLSIEQIRANSDKPNSGLFKMPAGVLAEKVQLDGLKGEWLRPTGLCTGGVLLYLHGGAYVSGSIQSHRRLAAKLALSARTATFVVEYRLAPEHPFPAALDDAVRTYTALRAGAPYTPIAIAGDSAGGGLALALCLRLRDAGIDAPAALALLSPWTDLALVNETHMTRSTVDPFFPNKSILSGAAAVYAGSHDLKNPFVSPQYADLRGLPPALIHVGDLEALLDDSRVLSNRMSTQGTPVTLEVYRGMWHVWQAFAGLFPEADRSVARLGAFLASRLNQQSAAVESTSQR